MYSATIRPSAVRKQAIVEHVIAGGDALVLMPTGGGKSLVLPNPRHRAPTGRFGHGITLVISPLIALMHDQVGALHEAGVSAAFLNSTLSSEEAYQIEQQLLRGEITLLYAAPGAGQQCTLSGSAGFAVRAQQTRVCSPLMRRIA